MTPNPSLRLSEGLGASAIPERSMDVEKSYLAVSWFFDSWVRLMEYHSRQIEAFDSMQLGPRRLLICPPTGGGRCGIGYPPPRRPA